MFIDFVAPLDDTTIQELQRSNPNKKQSIVPYYDGMPLDAFSIAMVGINDYNRHEAFKGVENASSSVRRVLYQYEQFTNGVQLLDLGNIIAGETFNDSLVALREVIKDCIKNNIILIIIGGDNECVKAQYEAMKIFEAPIKVAYVSSNNKIYIDNNYIKLFLNDVDLNALHFIALQSYMYRSDFFSALDDSKLKQLRVGKIRANLYEAEPLIREADLMAFDISAIRFSDAPAQLMPSPNGLFGDEACAIAKFAGMSEFINSFGIYNYFPNNDKHLVTAQQIAQMIWYFMEGVSVRTKDYPITDMNQFDQFTIHHDDMPNDLVFLRSKKTERWWMQIFTEHNGIQKHELIPCTYQDYLLAKQLEIPEAYIKAMNLLV
ncbi:MAG: hypothetical protein H6553_02975 [Chitinophagales bacterium]|nr:hypothetical protein [Chitinophagales bacterium]